jgi:general nucleoside transport system permease protein
LNEATPLTLAALGGVISERSGVVNIALEGMMLMSAFTGYVVAFQTHNLWLGVLAGVLTGFVISALHAALSINLMVDQIVSGFVINILALGITGVFFKGFLQEASVAGPGVLPTWHVPLLSSIPVIGPILFVHQPITYAMLIAIVLVQFLLFRTVWGLRTRAVGEHPLAADTVGINVYRVRYLAVILSGGLAGLGGTYFSLQQIGQFLPNMTGGRGFIALAAMIFGKWKPLGAFYACLLFAGAEAFAGQIQIWGWHIPVVGWPIPFQFLGMLPYLLTIIVVAGAMGRAVAPAADGKPYRKA